MLPGRLFEHNAWIVNSVDRSPGHGASEEAQARVRVVAAIERRCGSFPHMHVSDVGYRRPRTMVCLPRGRGDAGQDDGIGLRANAQLRRYHWLVMRSYVMVRRAECEAEINWSDTGGRTLARSRYKCGQHYEPVGRSRQLIARSKLGVRRTECIGKAPRQSGAAGGANKCGRRARG